MTTSNASARVGSHGGQQLLDQSCFAPGPHTRIRPSESSSVIFSMSPCPRRQPDGCRYDDSASPGQECGPPRRPRCSSALPAPIRASRCGRCGRTAVSDSRRFRSSSRPSSGIARVDFLFDGNGRGDARYQVYVGFVHLAQELPRVGRKALHIAALSLGEYRVESQRRFSLSPKVPSPPPVCRAVSRRRCSSGCGPGPFYIYAVFVSHGE